MSKSANVSLISDTSVQIQNGSDNSVPRASSNGEYNWCDVLYKKLQGGVLNTGATFSIMAHTGPRNAMVPAGLWSSRNTDPPSPGVLGISTDSQIATVNQIASVGFYNDAVLPPVFYTTGNDTTFTANSIVIASGVPSDIQTDLETEIWIRTSTDSMLGKVIGWTNNSIQVSGWWANANTSTGQIPANNQIAYVGVAEKVWTRNTNIIASNNSFGTIGIADEVGCGNYGISYDLYAGTGTQVNGINVVSIGSQNTHWAFLVSHQSGDGTFARGCYVSSAWYASYTASIWGTSDNTTPVYSYLSNYTNNYAFAVGGSTPSNPNQEKFYVQSTLGAIYTGASIGIGYKTSNTSISNRLIVMTANSDGSTNGFLMKNSANTTMFALSDQGNFSGNTFSGVGSTLSTSLTVGSSSTSSANRIIINTSNTNSTTNGLLVRNSANTSVFSVTDAGVIWQAGANSSVLKALTNIAAGQIAYCKNGRKTGEAAGAGTGVLVYVDSTGKWISSLDGLEITE